ncbi:hypothetical protein RRG08_036381 [Elysia crispata]|uniref:Uncharacterized protein n=1 Tax=Elysia crispata TaxID=231223 RepID=A0AAE0ZJW0_9GAST|nr:hypothetical protein RRG08_036381 [Elysia crispata]
MFVDLVHFFRKENYSTSTFFDTLTALSSKPLTYSNKEACIVEKEHKKLLKNKSRLQLEVINEFLHCGFATGRKPCKTSAASVIVRLQSNSDRSSVYTQTCGPRPDVARPLKQKIFDAEEQTRVVQDRADILQQECSLLLAKSRESCSENQRLKARVNDLEHSLLKKNEEIQSVKEELSSVSLSKLYKKIASLTDSSNEKDDTIKMLEKKCETVKSLKKDKLSLQKDCFRLNKKKQILLKELEEKDGLIAELQDILAQESQIIRTRTGRYNQLSDDMRKTIMSLEGDAGVSASKCPQVIDIVSKNLFHQTLDLPHWTTANKIVEEAHAVAKIHVAEALLENKNVTLHSDGTSREKKKFVGQQITLDNGRTLSLGFVEVAPEYAQTLLEVTSNALMELSELVGEEESF